jgi:hypothetical protein
MSSFRGHNDLSSCHGPAVVFKESGELVFVDVRVSADFDGHAFCPGVNRL